jgi:hypothetical protein
MAASETWTTKEEFPRTLVVAGYSAIDPDVLVARVPNSAEPYWIVESSGFVCGLNVYAERLTP